MEGNDASRSTPDCSTSMEAEDSETKRLQTEKQGKSSLIQIISKNFQRKIVNIFIPINFNICFGSSKEPSH